MLCAFLPRQEINRPRDVLVILNGDLVNPHVRGETTLKEGDEVIVLPMIAGGFCPKPVELGKGTSR